MDVCVGYFEPQNHCCDLNTSCSCLDFLRNCFSEEDHLLQLLILQVVEIVHFALWDDQSVALSQRGNVEKGKELVVLCYILARDLTCYNS